MTPFQAFEVFLTFLYTGEVEDIKTNAVSLLYAADKYQVTALTDVCSNYLKENLTTGNVSDCLIAGYLCKVPELEVAAITFSIDHPGTVNNDSLVKEHPELVWKMTLALQDRVKSNSKK